MIPLNQIQVPAPCSENWEGMNGDARRRFCAGCGCHVHDLSAMTRRDAQDLLDRTEGRVCVRFQTSADGVVLTQDAPAEAMTERRVFWPRGLAAAASWAIALALAGLGLTTARADTVNKTVLHKAKSHAAAPAARRSQMVLGRMMSPFSRPQATLGKVAPPLPPVMGGAMPPPALTHTMGAPLPATPPPPLTRTMGIVALPMVQHPALKK